MDEFLARMALLLGGSADNHREVRLAWNEAAGGYFDQLAALGSLPPEVARQREFLLVLGAIDNH